MTRAGNSLKNVGYSGEERNELIDTGGLCSQEYFKEETEEINPVERQGESPIHTRVRVFQKVHGKIIK